MTNPPRSAKLAWSVESFLHQGEMRARLEAIFPKPWTWGDSAIHGDYLGGRLTPEAVVRIYEVDDAFVVELRFYSASPDADAQLAAAKKQVEQLVLPLIEARNVHVTGALD